MLNNTATSRKGLVFIEVCQITWGLVVYAVFRAALRPHAIGMERCRTIAISETKNPAAAGFLFSAVHAAKALISLGYSTAG
jgi:hypothetical protein